MILVQYLALGVLLIANRFSEIEAHGRLMDPVNRGSAFRRGFSTPANFDDAGNYCGGLTVHKKNGGKCGVCGDNYNLTQPRPNENGGKYGRGVIVKTYNAGSTLVADVEITANHLGHFEFALCPLESETELETEECFDEYKLQLVSGGFKYPVLSPRRGHFLVDLRLPKTLTCEHCVLRWQYTAGNNWGICPDGRGRKGCGFQETFRTCSDIKIQ